MNPVQQRAYKAAHQRDRRARIAAEKDENNVVLLDAITARDALADAALMLLSLNLPGADQVRGYLGKVFRTQVGAPLTIESRIKAGAMKPKLLPFTLPKA